MARAGIAVLLLVAASARATSFSYDFDGDFSASFTRVNPEDDRYFFDQEDGELAYFVNENSTSGVIDPTNSPAVVHNTFRPRYDQSWQVSVDVTMPLNYFEQGLVSGFADAGISVVHFPFGIGTDTGSRFFEASLDTRSLVRVLSGQVSDSDSNERGRGETNSLEETVTLFVRFDAGSRTLSALTIDGLFYSVALDETGPLDWNMDDSDQFLIALFAGSELEPITPDDAITLDNFRAAIIPEPAATALLLLGFAGAGRRSPRVLLVWPRTERSTRHTDLSGGRCRQRTTLPRSLA